MKPVAVVAAILLAGLVAVGVGWVIGGLAWTVIASLGVEFEPPCVSC